MSNVQTKIVTKFINDFIYGIISLQKYNIHSDDDTNQDFVINYKTDELGIELMRVIQRKLQNKPLEENISLREKYIFDNIVVKDDSDNDGYFSLSSKDEIVQSALEKYEKQMNLVNLSKKQNQKLVLSNIVSVFETLTSDLTEYVLLNIYNQISVIDKVSLKPEDLDTCESIEDAKKLLVQKYLSDIKYKKFDEWFAIMLEICVCGSKNGKKYISENLAEKVGKVNEIMQRRNIVVHNNGIINTEYLKKVKPEFNIDNFEKGETVELTSEYLLNSSRIVLELGTFFIGESFFKKRIYNNSDIERTVELIGLELYRLKEYSSGQNLFNSLLKYTLNNNADPGDYFINNFNYLLGFKLQNDIDFSEELLIFLENVEKDASLNLTENSHYSIGISCLKDPQIVFLEKALSFLEYYKGNSKVITFLEWPMFNLIRKEKEFVEFELSLYYNKDN